MNRPLALTMLAALIAAPACSTPKSDANPGTLSGRVPDRTSGRTSGLDEAVRRHRVAAATPERSGPPGASEATSAPPRTARRLFLLEEVLHHHALPQGYPDPTPPGAIELKRHPTVRRAEMRMEADKGVNSHKAATSPSGPSSITSARTTSR
jgi:hypothetical protein